MVPLSRTGIWYHQNGFQVTKIFLFPGFYRCKWCGSVPYTQWRNQRFEPGRASLAKRPTNCHSSMR